MRYTTTVRRIVYWTLTLLLVSLIFVSDVIGRHIVNLLKADTPFKSLVLIGFIAFLLFLFAFLYGKLVIRKVSTYLLLSLGLGLYTYMALLIVRQPEETIHYLEFSILSYLIYRSVFLDLSGLRGWIGTIGLTVFFCWSAEYLQLYIPGRVYDLQDMVMNGVGSIFGLIFIWIVLMEKKTFARPH